MSILGKWRIAAMPDDTDDYPDMMEPAYILFEPTRGEFAFGCVTGAFAGGGDHDAVEFDWDGNHEMDEACGDGWAELQPDGTSSAKSASTAVMKSPSSHADGRLLQQPASLSLNILAAWPEFPSKPTKDSSTEDGSRRPMRQTLGDAKSKA